MERPRCCELENTEGVFRSRRCDVDSCDVDVLVISEVVTKFAELSVATTHLKNRCHVSKPCYISEEIKDPIQAKPPKVPTRLQWMFTQVPTNANFREEVCFENVVEFVPRRTVQPNLPKVVLIAAFKCIMFIVCRGRKPYTGV